MIKSEEDLLKQKTALLNLRDEIMTKLGRIDGEMKKLGHARTEVVDKFNFIIGKIVMINEILGIDDSQETTEEKQNGGNISKP